MTNVCNWNFQNNLCHFWIRTGFLNLGPWSSLGAMERFSGSHEQKPLLNSSAVILQNLIDEQGVTGVDSLWKGATNHKSLRTTG